MLDTHPSRVRVVVAEALEEFYYGFTQVAYGTGVDTIGGAAAFTYTAGTDTLSVGVVATTGTESRRRYRYILLPTDGSISAGGALGSVAANTFVGAGTDVTSTDRTSCGFGRSSARSDTQEAGCRSWPKTAFLKELSLISPCHGRYGSSARQWRCFTTCTTGSITLVFYGNVSF